MRLCVLAALVGGAAPRDREGARPAGARRRRLSDSATFKLLATRTASDAAPLRNYGFAVAVDDDTIMSGAAGCDPALNALCPIIIGSVYVLRASDGEELAKLSAPTARRATSSANPWLSTETPSWSGPEATIT